MKINDAKLLLPDFSSGQAEIWADLGCGSGTFTYALSEKLPDRSKIFAIDKTHKNLENPIVK